MSRFSQLEIKPNVPKWAEPLIKWCHNRLVPEWSVVVSAEENPNGENWEAYTQSQSDYLQASITLCRDAEETPEYELVIIHEFLHPIFAAIQEFTRRIVDDDETLYETYHSFEEQSVVRLSRVIHGLWTVEKLERQDN